MASTCTQYPDSLKKNGCAFDLGVMENVIFMPLKKADGSTFEVSALTLSVLQGLITQANPLDRIYPLDSEADDVEDTAGEPTIHTSGSKRNFYVSQGTDSLGFQVYN